MHADALGYFKTCADIWLITGNKYISDRVLVSPKGFMTPHVEIAGRCQQGSKAINIPIEMALSIQNKIEGKGTAYILGVDHNTAFNDDFIINVTE